MNRYQFHSATLQYEPISC